MSDITIASLRLVQTWCRLKEGEIIEEENGSLVFLGDWLTKFSVTRLNENGIWQGNWEEFIKKLA